MERNSEVMVTSSGDMLLTPYRRYLSSPLFVSRDFECDQLHRLASPRRGDTHHQPSPVDVSNIASPL
jgi:hypothetical protein